MLGPRITMTVLFTGILVLLSVETKPVSYHAAYQFISPCDRQGCQCYVKYAHLVHLSKQKQLAENLRPGKVSGQVFPQRTTDPEFVPILNND